jgi:hypothetical protein
MDPIRDKWLESFPLDTLGASFLPANSCAFVHVVTRPIVLAPGQSINDLTLEQQLDRGVDWEATAWHSAILINVALPVPPELAEKVG